MALVLPDRDPEISEGKYTTWDDNILPLKCAYLLKRHRLACVLFMCAGVPVTVCTSVCFCAGFQHMFWTERIMALFTPHYPVNK